MPATRTVWDYQASAGRAWHGLWLKARLIAAPSSVNGEVTCVGTLRLWTAGGAGIATGWVGGIWAGNLSRWKITQLGSSEWRGVGGPLR